MSWRQVLPYERFEYNCRPQAGIWRGYAVDYASRSLGLALFENTTHVFPFTLSMDMLGFERQAKLNLLGSYGTIELYITIELYRTI